MDNSKYKKILGFNTKKVLVIGDSMLDVYICGKSKRICREAPVPMVEVASKKNLAGGAANTALNIAKLGGKCFFLSAVGDDLAGRKLKDILQYQKVDIENMLSGRKRTISKQRIVANEQILVRFDFDLEENITGYDEEKILSSLERIYPNVDCVIVSDYGYGVLTENIINKIQVLQDKLNKVLAIDAKYINRYKNVKATFVKPNYEEASSFLKKTKKIKSKDRIEFIENNKKILFENINSKIIAVTLDIDGSLVLTKEKIYRTVAVPKDNSKAAGAGDTYTAAFSLSLASGATIEEASDIASSASSVVVNKEFTAQCSQNELLNILSSNSKLLDGDIDIMDTVVSLKNSEKTIVFTNGCFDILHSGHVEYLKKAKSLGDILIVGLNSDSSIKRIKGEQRPINALLDRVRVLAGLESVDYIVPFADNTPVELVRKIKPQFYVKGGDYTVQDLPEAKIVEEYGGKVFLIPYLEGYSTTAIISRIAQDRSIRRVI